jgi:hypothetical protein
MQMLIFFSLWRRPYRPSLYSPDAREEISKYCIKAARVWSPRPPFKQIAFDMHSSVTFKCMPLKRIRDLFLQMVLQKIWDPESIVVPSIPDLYELYL